MIPEDDYRAEIEEVGPGFKCGLCGEVIPPTNEWHPYEDEAAKTTRTLHISCMLVVLDLAMSLDDVRQRALSRIRSGLPL